MHHQQHAFSPDLRPCTLEDRVLPAYSPAVAPLILTTGGYVVLSNPPGLNSALGSQGSANYSGGGSGGNVPTSFNISGFGPSSFAIGNSTGFPSLNSLSGGGSTAGGVGLQTTVGSGANTPGGGAGTSSGLAANGTTVSSGYNTGLSGSNAYGTSSTSTVGSVPVHTFDTGATGVSGTGNSASTSPSAPTNAANGGNAGSTGGNAGQGATSNYQNSLLGQKLGGPGSLLSSPDNRNP